MFKWYVVWSGPKNKYQKEMCLKEIGQRAQNMMTILDSISQHNRGNLHDHLMRETIETHIP